MNIFIMITKCVFVNYSDIPTELKDSILSCLTLFMRISATYITLLSMVLMGKADFTPSYGNYQIESDYSYFIIIMASAIGQASDLMTSLA